MKIVYCRLSSSFMSLIAQILRKEIIKKVRNFLWKFCLIYRLKLYSDLKLGTFFPHSVEAIPDTKKCKECFHFLVDPRIGLKR